MPKYKPRIYLAGPISGCNDAQKHKWRDEIQRKYGKYLDFIDPTKMLGEFPYEAVKTDLRAIEEADGLLVNMWRESIGSAIGVVLAHRAAQPVVVVDPNRFGNLILNFYADIVEDTPLKAANAMLKLLRSTDWKVIKSGDRGDEPFDRRKLVASIRQACRAAKRDDLIVPRLVMQKVLEHLEKSDRKLKKTIPTSDIYKAVTTSLEELQTEPDYMDDVIGVLEKWRHQHKKKPSSKTLSQPHQTPLTPKIRVKISGTKSHGTIWGNTVTKLSDIPSTDAKKVFQLIAGILGITEITLRHFAHEGKKPACVAIVTSSKTSNIIEGKLFDKEGIKGTMQTFQVGIQDDAEKKRILGEITAKLKEQGCWAG